MSTNQIDINAVNERTKDTEHNIIMFGKLIAGAVEGEKKVRDRYKHLLDENIKHSIKPIYMIHNRTPFEQKAYQEQFRKRNRVSGPELGETPDISETRGDRDVLFSIVGIVLFIILLMSV